MTIFNIKSDLVFNFSIHTSVSEACNRGSSRVRYYYGSRNKFITHANLPGTGRPGVVDGFHS